MRTFLILAVVQAAVAIIEFSSGAPYSSVSNTCDWSNPSKIQFNDDYCQKLELCYTTPTHNLKWTAAGGGAFDINIYAKFDTTCASATGKYTLNKLAFEGLYNGQVAVGRYTDNKQYCLQFSKSCNAPKTSCLNCMTNGLKEAIKKECTQGAVDSVKDTLKQIAKDTFTKYLEDTVIPSLTAADLKASGVDTAVAACESCVDAMKEELETRECDSCPSVNLGGFLTISPGALAGQAIELVKPTCTPGNSAGNAGGSNAGGSSGGSVKWCQNNLFCDSTKLEGATALPGGSASENKAKCKKLCDDLKCSYYTLAEGTESDDTFCMNYGDTCANAWKSEANKGEDFYYRKNPVTYGKGDASKCEIASGAKEMQVAAVVTLLPILLFLA